MVGTNAELSFERDTTYIAGLSVKRLLVEYQQGNEFLNLGKFLEVWKELGDSPILEYYGRGSIDDPQKLVAEITISDEKYQLVYFLS